MKTDNQLFYCGNEDDDFQNENATKMKSVEFEISLRRQNRNELFKCLRGSHISTVDELLDEQVSNVIEILKSAVSSNKSTADDNLNIESCLQSATLIIENFDKLQVHQILSESAKESFLDELWILLIDQKPSLEMSFEVLHLISALSVADHDFLENLVTDYFTDILRIMFDIGIFSIEVDSIVD